MSRPDIAAELKALRLHGMEQAWEELQQPGQSAVLDASRWLIEHLHDHYALYGEYTGVRSARKHIGWYVADLPQGEGFRARMNTLETAQAQLAAVADFFDALHTSSDRLPRAQARQDNTTRDTMKECTV